METLTISSLIIEPELLVTFEEPVTVSIEGNTVTFGQGEVREISSDRLLDKLAAASLWSLAWEIVEKTSKYLLLRPIMTPQYLPRLTRISIESSSLLEHASKSTSKTSIQERTINTDIEEFISGETTTEELVALFPDGPASEWPDFLMLYFTVGDRVRAVIDHLNLTTLQREEILYEYLSALKQEGCEFNTYGSCSEDLASNIGEYMLALGLSLERIPCLDDIVTARQRLEPSYR